MNPLPDNYVQLTGHLGQDVDLRELAQGKKLARISLATNEYRKKGDGPAEKFTAWHSLTAWGKTAEEMSALLHKGSKICVEGKLAYRQYETKTGEKRYTTEIVVQAFRQVPKEEPVA